MSTSFSFDCPQCGKNYDRVKPEMAGRKVQCNCGKIFRLGPKTPEQLAEDERRRARRAVRKAQKASNTKPLNKRPAQTHRPLTAPQSSPTPEVVSQRPVQALSENDGLFIEPEEEIVDAMVLDDEDEMDSSRSTSSPIPVSPVLEGNDPTIAATTRSPAPAQIPKPKVSDTPSAGTVVSPVQSPFDSFEDLQIPTPVNTAHESPFESTAVSPIELPVELPDTEITLPPEPTSVPLNAIPVDAIPVAPIPSEPIPVEPIPVAPIPVEPVDAKPIPVTPIPVEPVTNLHTKSAEPVVPPPVIPVQAPLPVQGLYEGVGEVADGYGFAQEAQDQRLVTPNPFKKKKKRVKRKKQYDDPMGGAIWTLAYGVPGSLIQLLVSFGFSSVPNRYSDAVKIVVKLFSILPFICALAIFVSAGFAVVEMIQKRRNGIPTMVTGYIALATIVANAMFCGIGLLGLQRGGVQPGEVGKLFLFFLVLSVVPLTAAITGFCRNQPEM